MQSWGIICKSFHIYNCLCLLDRIVRLYECIWVMATKGMRKKIFLKLKKKKFNKNLVSTDILIFPNHIVFVIKF